jgi:hypothetical protein
MNLLGEFEQGKGGPGARGGSGAAWTRQRERERSAALAAPGQGCRVAPIALVELPLSGCSRLRCVAY